MKKRSLQFVFFVMSSTSLAFEVAFDLGNSACQEEGAETLLPQYQFQEYNQHFFGTPLLNFHQFACF